MATAYIQQGSQNDLDKSAHGYYRYPQACGFETCDPMTGFSTYESSYIPQPKDCYFGQKDSRYSNLGSYVKSAYYTSGCISEDCDNSLASRSRCRKVPKPPLDIGYGLSSGDLMFPGPCAAQGGYSGCNFDVSRYDPCNSGMVGCDPCSINQDCHPFDDTVIDEPRDLAYLDSQRGDYTFITTNFNQTRDLRGDLPISMMGLAPGSSLTTHGPCAQLKPFRGYVY